jgi:hypothetical protein
MFDDSIEVVQHLRHGGAAVFFGSRSHAVLLGDSVSRLWKARTVMWGWNRQLRAHAQTGR